MPVIGVAGGIASGKTTVCKLFERWGAIIIDADYIGRQVIDANPDLLARLVDHFGTDILDQQGKLDRRSLGRIIFSDDRARGKLDEIVHPALLDELKRQVSDCQVNNPRSVIVIDAALLLEWNLGSLLDAVIVVRSTSKQRLERLVKHAGLTAGEAEERISAQSHLEAKSSLADFIISNNGHSSDLERQARDTWEKVLDLPKFKTQNTKHDSGDQKDSP